MEHSERVLREMENAASAVTSGGHDLGTWIILSALYSEFALTGVLKEEKRKMEKFNKDCLTKTAKNFIDFDAEVANVLKHACCLEKQIVEKIRMGVNYQNANTPPTQPPYNNCCSR